MKQTLQKLQNRLEEVFNEALEGPSIFVGDPLEPANGEWLPLEQNDVDGLMRDISNIAQKHGGEEWIISDVNALPRELTGSIESPSRETLQAWLQYSQEVHRRGKVVDAFVKAFPDEASDALKNRELQRTLDDVFFGRYEGRIKDEALDEFAFDVLDRLGGDVGSLSRYVFVHDQDIRGIANNDHEKQRLRDDSVQFFLDRGYTEDQILDSLAGNTSSPPVQLDTEAYVEGSLRNDFVWEYIDNELFVFWYR